MKICFRLLVAVLFAMFVINDSQPASAQSVQNDIDVSTVIHLLADGRPWKANMSKGPTAMLTLNANGKGLFEGPMKRSVTWEMKSNLLCIYLGFPLGTKCVTVRKTDSGFDFYKGNKKDLALTR